MSELKALVVSKLNGREDLNGLVEASITAFPDLDRSVIAGLLLGSKPEEDGRVFLAFLHAVMGNFNFKKIPVKIYEYLYNRYRERDLHKEVKGENVIVQP